MSKIIRPTKGVLRIVCESPRPYGRTKVQSSNDAFLILKKEYDDHRITYQEEFKLLMLTRALTIIGVSSISAGSGHGTVVDSKMVAQHAILSHASSVILCHNHPSGYLKPSKNDQRITSQVKEGLNLFNIDVLDHLIINKEEFLSFADEGLL